MHACSDIATSYLIHNNSDISQDLLILAHSIEIVVNLLYFLGLFYDKALLFDDIILDSLKKKISCTLSSCPYVV
jgi:hypothetical protein